MYRVCGAVIPEEINIVAFASRPVPVTSPSSNLHRKYTVIDSVISISHSCVFALIARGMDTVSR